jgi:hypothetical protein
MQRFTGAFCILPNICYRNVLVVGKLKKRCRMFAESTFLRQRGRWDIILTRNFGWERF